MNAFDIIFTDLDGTLLNSEKRISQKDSDCLMLLNEQQIIRVFATGRSLFSFQNLFTDTHIPADYLLFSTGAGIINLANGELVYSETFDNRSIQQIATHFMEQEVDFMVHRKVPENHHFQYHGDRERNRDFAKRIELYESYASEFFSTSELPDKSAQIIAILPNDMGLFGRVKKGLEKYTVTRTTSPLDHSSIWMEIYPKHVSKGESANWLCNHLKIDTEKTVGIGNDYNDISLLQFTRFSYIMENGPEDLRSRYLLTGSNDNSGFSQAIDDVLKRNPE